jgi:hypothetical protein
MKQREHSRVWWWVALWAVVTALFGILYAEYSLSALDADSSDESMARIITYATAGFTVVGMLGVAWGLGAVIWTALRWIDVRVGFGTVVGSLWPAFAYMAAYAAVASLLLLLAPSPHVPDDVLENWDRYQESLMSQHPLSLIHWLRNGAMIAAAVGVWATVRRRARCSWLDASIAVGAAVAVLVILAGAVRLVSR